MSISQRTTFAIINDKVDPHPYHQGPEIPNLYATALDCSWSNLFLVSLVIVQRTIMPTKVAAHVHADTIPEAINPGLTHRDALLNSSEFLGEKAV
jgi:hypothetical protein